MAKADGFARAYLILAKYYYKIRTPKGEMREGSVEANSLESAVRGLQKQNVVIVSVKPSRFERSFVGLLSRSVEHISAKDAVIISRQLATLFEARIPVVQALRTMSGEVPKPGIRKILTEMLDDIQGGMSMSQAMEKHPKLFSGIYINMVKSGEESGKLGEVFTYLADYMERSYELRGRVKGALLYPAFILFAFVVVIVLMMTMIIPNIAAIFEESNVELPIYTRIVVGSSLFFKDFWIVIFVALSLTGAFLWRYVQTPAGRRAWARLKISIPIFGNLNKKVYIARFSDNLQTLLSAGVPVIRSLQVTADVIGNEVYRDIILDSIKSVRGGATISDALVKYSEMPPLVSQMIKIGEESGKLNVILSSLSRFYKREVDNLVENFVSLIEPVLIIVLGIGVAFLVASVLLPLYSISAAF